MIGCMSDTPVHLAFEEGTLVITGGSLLQDGQTPDLSTTRALQYVGLWPALILALLLLFLADIVIRRWEHVQGFWEMLRGGGGGRKGP